MTRAMRPLDSICAAAVAAVLLSLQPLPAQAQTAEQVQETKKARAEKAAQLRAERAARKAGAAPAPAPDAPLAPADAAQLSAAEMVHYGTYECEFNQRLEVKLSPRAPGYVHVLGVGHDFTMRPIASQTGAIRLEDVKNIGLMLQIASKSMLMNLKTGQRMIDACVHPKHLGAGEVKN